MNVNGVDMSLVDLNLDTVKKYASAGSVNINSVIMNGISY